MHGSADAPEGRRSRASKAWASAIDWNELHAQRFRAALDDDFGTPDAVAVLFDLAAEVNRTHSAAVAAQLKGLAGTIGLLAREPQAFCRRHLPPTASRGDDDRSDDCRPCGRQRKRRIRRR